MNEELLGRELFVWGATTITLMSVAIFFVTLISAFVVAVVAHRLLSGVLGRTGFLKDGERKSISRMVYYLILVFGTLTAFDNLGISLGKPFLTLGDSTISLYSLATFAALTFLVVVGSNIAGRLVGNRLPNLDDGLRYAISRITYYVLLVTGLMAALQTIGIQLGSLTVLVGALGVGLGFGLQNIVNNFVSGLILLFERPIKVGDWIEVDGTKGQVTDIGARSTTVVTRDNITIIIPNGDCLANQMINWSYRGTQIRLRLPIGVAYGSDMDKVKKALLEAAAEHPKVLETPAPSVLFDEFGDSSLNLELAVWIDVTTIGPQALRSDIYWEVDKKFRAAEIEIPFPQRDLNFRNQLSLEELVKR